MRPPSHRVAAYGLRASDTERDEAISELRSRFAEGRLSQETFLFRMDVALRAKDQAELSHLFVDLPAGEARPRGIRRLLGSGWSARARLAALRRPGWAAGRSGAPARRPGPAGEAASPGPDGAAGYVPVPAAFQPLLPPQPLYLPRQEDGRFTIGRAPACDFTVADLSVSRRHARLHKEDESWMLSDLGSTNGTRLNGWRVTDGVQVRPGDQVTFGSVTYVISAGPVS
jgi:FHA domain/Domain of unknown function (DUF1707)